MATRSRWRIDDLAQRSGVSVDTIRFYLREELLPPAEREGRVTLFGPEHLARLAQIRELQSRRLNLAAIRRLVHDETQAGFVDALFGTGEGSYTDEELAASADVDVDLVRALADLGLLDAEPFDDSDVRAVAAVNELIGTGMPRPVVLALVRIYVDHFAAMREEAAAIFTGDPSAAGVEWSDTERDAFIAGAPEHLATILPLTARILGHIHHRSVRRMTVQGLGFPPEEG